jgi:hypothetical protein
MNQNKPDKHTTLYSKLYLILRLLGSFLEILVNKIKAFSVFYMF